MKLKRVIAAVLSFIILATALPFCVTSADTPYKGVDVSRWQGNINWKTMKSAGVDFAILRCFAEVKDIKFEDYYKGATENGIAVGAYVYMYATTEAQAKKEAESAVAALAGRSLTFPLFLDVEDSRLMSLGKKTLTDLMLIELKIFAAAGYKVGIYSTQAYLASYADMSRLSNYYLWIAKWTLYAADNNSSTYKFSGQNPYSSNPGAHMWQFSNGGDGKTFGTDSKFVDMDYCYYDFIGGSRNLYPYSSVNPDDYYVPERNISYTKGKAAMTGFDVAWIQAVLYRIGYSISIDGSFGPASSDAVKDFQKNHSIGTDGIVGPTTRAALIKKWEKIKSACSHKWSKTVIAPTCTAEGYTVYSCSLCGSSYTADKVSALGHSFDSGVEVIPPTETSEGQMLFTCTRAGCGESYTEAIPVLVMRGDANGDGDITMSDVLLLRRIIAGLEDEERAVLRGADVIPDGSLDMRDVMKLRRMIAGLD